MVPVATPLKKFMGLALIHFQKYWLFYKAYISIYYLVTIIKNLGTLNDSKNICMQIPCFNTMIVFIVYKSPEKKIKELRSQLSIA